MPGPLMDGLGKLSPEASPAERALNARLEVRARFGMRLGLERMEAALARIGHPERRFRSVQIAGTNGKGSTSAFLASILGRRLRTGLYTSPHLESVTERIQIDGRPIEPEVFLDAIDRADEPDLTFFELITAAGFLVFAERGVELAVLEAGLGAKLDATTAAPAEVSVLTDVGLEHRAVLGDTLADIAREKAHVTRPGRPLVCADSGPAVDREVDRHAQAIGCPVHRIGRELVATGNRFELQLSGRSRAIERIALSLEGPYQTRNALLATAAALLVEPSLSDDEVRAGLAAARWPGRFERFELDGAKVILDGAHNPPAIQALLAALPPRFDLLFGSLGDKDAKAMLAHLAPRVRKATFVSPSNPRATPAKDLLQIWPGSDVRAIDDPIAGLEHAAASAGGSVLVVCGSLYLVGEVRGRLRRAGVKLAAHSDPS